MKNKIFILGILLLSFLASFANGGGVYAVSSVTRSTNPMFRNIKDVSILSEKLDIKLVGERSYISVTYVLWNNSNKDYLDVDYGFPIDYAYDKNNEYSSFMWKDHYLQDVSFVQDSKELDFVNSEGVILPNSKDVAHNGEIYRKWFYTQISMKKQSLSTLTVEYSLANSALGDGDSPLHISYYDSGFQYNLTYDFSPASHWGSGLIRDFSVKIDFSDLQFFLHEDFVGTEECKGLSITGLDFVQDGKTYICEKRNFNLNNAKTLSLKYCATEPTYMNAFIRHRLEGDKYKISTSSQKSTYPASNLIDLDLESAWVSDGVEGEYIDFIFDEPIRNLAGLLFVNGYQKNENVYDANSKVSKYRIEATYAPDELDENGNATDPPIFGDYQLSSDIELENMPYKKLYFSNLFENIRHVDFYDNFDAAPIKKLRITILDTYKGAKSDDLCISEIILLKQ